MLGLPNEATECHLVLSAYHESVSAFTPHNTHHSRFLFTLAFRVSLFPIPSPEGK